MLKKFKSFELLPWERKVVWDFLDNKELGFKKTNYALHGRL